MLKPISTEQLDRLADGLERASRDVTVDRGVLKESLLALLEAVGRADDGTGYADAFREAATDAAGHADLAKRFRAIAKADDPLDPDLCSGIVLTELNTAARTMWSGRHKKRLVNRPHPLRDVAADLLTRQELDDVRTMAQHLANYHQSHVRRKRPNKLDQDTLLQGLADIYIEFAQLNCDRYELPHAVHSHFVMFVYHALRPHFGLTEASAKSISNRWKGLKDANSRP